MMFRALLRTRFAALIAAMTPRGKDGKRRGKGMMVVMCLLLVYVAGIIMVSSLALFYNAAGKMAGTDNEWMYFAIALLFAFSLSFIGSIFTTKMQLFEAKDNELLLSMPVPPSYILASRSLYLYIVSLAYILVIMLPALAVGLFTGLLGALSALFMLLGTLLLPLAVLAFSSFFAWLLALVTAKSGKKSLVTTVLSLAFFVAYFIFCMNMNKYVSLLLDNISAIATALKFPLSPFYAFGAGLSNGIAGAPQYLIFAAWCILPFGAAAWVISASFIRIATMRAGRSKAKYREGKIRVRTPGAALLAKELRHFFSCSAYVLNCGMGNVLIIIASVAMLINRGTILGLFGADASEEYAVIAGIIAAAVPGIPLFCSAMSPVTAPSISLEGKNLWILQSMPVSGSTVLMSKVWLHIVVNTPAMVIFSFCAGITFRLGIPAVISMLLLGVASTFFYAFFGIVLNLKHHNFDWVNETVPLKQSASVMISTFAGMGISLLYFVPAIALAVFGIPSWAVNLVCTLPFALVAWLMFRYIMKKGGRKFETLS
ncbi:putative uncharacterized protein [Anaerotruncus sp. CAG:390]|nr:putative uncharacterized protein [Anaerotruncus sp. CAG:390]